MRPRVFPAEDRVVAVARPARLVASMRPRVFPAERLAADGTTDTANDLASMRPRVFPAEDAARRRTDRGSRYPLQ